MLVYVVKEHEPHINLTDSKNKPWRAQKIYLDLVNAGFECRLFASSFDHWSKSHTPANRLSPEFSKATLLNAPAYPHNSSILRFASGLVFGFRFLLDGLRDRKPTDVIVSLPGFLIFVSALLLKALRGSRVHLDIRDDWSGTLSSFFPRALRPSAYQAFRLWLRFLLMFADTIIVPSQNLLESTRRLTKKSIIKIPFLLDRERVLDVGTDDDGRDMLFLGSLNSFFDYDVFKQAASYCRNQNVVLHVLGEGEQFNNVRRMFEGHPQVCLHGHVAYSEVPAIASNCRIGLYPYRSTVGFEYHETNKLTDYLTLGLVVFSTVPLPISEKYFRIIPPFPPNVPDKPDRAEIVAYGLSNYVGTYAERLIAAGVLTPSS